MFYVLTCYSMNHVTKHFLAHSNFSIMNVCKLKYWHIIEYAKMYLYVYILKKILIKKIVFFSNIYFKITVEKKKNNTRIFFFFSF